jgi:flagellar biosynthesis/type III secretory pathway chaperone
MAGMVNQLISILNEQNERHSELLGLSKEKREAIIKNDIKHLQKITNLENLITSQTMKLERKRMALMDDITSVLCVESGTVTLSELADALKGQDEHAELVSTGEKIRKTLNELTQENNLNASLIQIELDYIEYSINVIQTSANQSPADFSTGGAHRESAGLFDARN